MASARRHLRHTGVVHQVPQPIGAPYKRNVVPCMQRVPVMDQDAEQLVPHRSLPANLTNAHNSRAHRCTSSSYVSFSTRSNSTGRGLQTIATRHIHAAQQILKQCMQVLGKGLAAHRLDMNGDRSSHVSKSTRLLIFVRDRAENSKRFNCNTKTAGASCSRSKHHVFKSAHGNLANNSLQSLNTCGLMTARLDIEREGDLYNHALCRADHAVLARALVFVAAVQ